MKKWLGIRTSIIIIIGIGFITLENVVGSRFYLLLGLLLGVLVMPVIRKKMPLKYHVISLLLDVSMVFVMSLSSRYVINYYIYILLMLLIVEAGLLYNIKYSKYIILIIMTLTLYHYGVLYYFRSNLGTVSEIIFMLVINILIIFSMYLIHQNQKEKEIQHKLNQQLEHLTSVAVKNNIARDIHDTFGHDMMALIMEIEMAGVLIDKDKDKAKEMMNQAKGSARKGMKTIRQVVETLRNEEELIQESIEQLILNYKTRLNITINYKLTDGIENNAEIKEVMYRLIQECMTNSIRHGGADVIDIELKKGLNTLVFRICDNGIGTTHLNEGYGLKGMRERIEAFNGKVNFKHEDGFCVEGYIEVLDD